MKIEITRRSRNLGYGWNTTPTGNGPEIEATTTPNVTGGWKAIFAEIERKNKICGHSTYHTTAFFVGGKKVVDPSLKEIIDELFNYPYFLGNKVDSITVTVKGEAIK